jgi:hypothetical protein
MESTGSPCGSAPAEDIPHLGVPVDSMECTGSPYGVPMESLYNPSLKGYSSGSPCTVSVGLQWYSAGTPQGLLRTRNIFK